MIMHEFQTKTTKQNRKNGEKRENYFMCSDTFKNKSAFSIASCYLIFDTLPCREHGSCSLDVHALNNIRSLVWPFLRCAASVFLFDVFIFFFPLLMMFFQLCVCLFAALFCPKCNRIYLTLNVSRTGNSLFTGSSVHVLMLFFFLSLFLFISCAPSNISFEKLEQFIKKN